MQRARNSQTTKLKDLLTLMSSFLKSYSNFESVELMQDGHRGPEKAGAQKHTSVLFLGSWHGLHYRTDRRRRLLYRRSRDN